MIALLIAIVVLLAVIAAAVSGLLYLYAASVDAMEKKRRDEDRWWDPDGHADEAIDVTGGAR